MAHKSASPGYNNNILQHQTLPKVSPMFQEDVDKGMIDILKSTQTRSFDKIIAQIAQKAHIHDKKAVYEVNEMVRKLENIQLSDSVTGKLTNFRLLFLNLGYLDTTNKLMLQIFEGRMVYSNTSSVISDSVNKKSTQPQIVSNSFIKLVHMYQVSYKPRFSL